MPIKAGAPVRRGAPDGCFPPDAGRASL